MKKLQSRVRPGVPLGRLWAHSDVSVYVVVRKGRERWQCGCVKRFVVSGSKFGLVVFSCFLNFDRPPAVAKSERRSPCIKPP